MIFTVVKTVETINVFHELHSEKCGKGLNPRYNRSTPHVLCKCGQHMHRTTSNIYNYWKCTSCEVRYRIVAPSREKKESRNNISDVREIPIKEVKKPLPPILPIYERKTTEEVKIDKPVDDVDGVVDKFMDALDDKVKDISKLQVGPEWRETVLKFLNYIEAQLEIQQRAIRDLRERFKK